MPPAAADGTWETTNLNHPIIWFGIVSTMPKFPIPNRTLTGSNDPIGRGFQPRQKPTHKNLEVRLRGEAALSPSTPANRSQLANILPANLQIISLQRRIIILRAWSTPRRKQANVPKTQAATSDLGSGL
jgi:hypothetical protein